MSFGTAKEEIATSDAIWGSTAKIGDIKNGHQIGKKGYWNARMRYIFLACIDCGEGRWTEFRKNTPLRCRSCSMIGQGHNRWKGGRTKTAQGYIFIKLFPANFFYPMARKDSYVLEHRLVMAKHLGRCLHSWEIVHHKNGIKDDNRIENLQLVTDDRHKQITLLEMRIARLEKRITSVEAENILLREQLREVDYGLR